MCGNKYITTKEKHPDFRKRNFQLTKKRRADGLLFIINM